MMDASAWRVPLRSLDSTEAQGLTAAWQVSTKILQAFGNFILSSSVRHSVEASSTSREPHLIPPHHCSRSYNGDGVGRSTERLRSVGSTRSNPALVLHSLKCKNAEVRTRQALCNRIQLVDCCRRTLGTALASRTTRWKSI